MTNSRRDFLKKGALGTAAIALSGSTSGAVAGILESRTQKIPHASETVKELKQFITAD